MKPLTKKQLEQKGCIFFTTSHGTIVVSGPHDRWSVGHAKTMVTARKWATMRIYEEDLMDNSPSAL